MLQIIKVCPAVNELVKEEIEAVPSGLKVTFADHQNQQACR